MSAYLRMLRDNPNYTHLWIAQSISLLGDWFSTIALSAIVSRYSGGSGWAVGLFMLARFTPPLFIGPFAGVLVDRFNRKRLLVISDCARTVIVLMFLLVRSADQLWLVYVFTVMQFCLSAMFEPARSAIVPSVVKADDLVRANMLGSATWSVMLAAGALIGGVVAGVLGTSTALVIDAASFALSALFLSKIVVRVTTKHTTRLGFRDGLHYIRQHPATAATLFIKLGGSVGSVDVLMTIFATQIFVLGTDGAGSLGVFWGAFGLGAVLGPVVMNRFAQGSVRTMRRLVIVGYGIISVGWFLFGGSPTLILAAGALVIKATGSSIYWTYSSVILQKTVADEYLGRVFSLDLAGFQLATVISILVTSWAAQQVGLAGVRSLVFATGAVSLVPLTLWALAIPWIERQDAHTAIGVVSPEAISPPQPSK